MTESDFQAFESVSALVVVLDVDGRIVYWNPSCSGLTGYSLDEARGRELWDFVLAREEEESVRAVFAMLLLGGSLPGTFANYWVDKAGARRWIAWSPTVTRRPDGQIQYIIGTGIDRTERKEAEDARRASVYDLLEANQHMVSATIRAQELADQAEEALARAEASERELLAVAEFREMFIGIVGHDLRNPLASILVAAETQLQRGHLDDTDRMSAARIIKSSQRMSRMIRQLLDLTRARLGGGIQLEPKPTDLREVCRSVAEELGPAIQLQVDGDLTGTWDPDRLVEALSNIAGNAVEHAAPGTPVVVRARPEDAEVVVEVVNRGEPIPADFLPFIFDPFRQAQPGRSASGHLGLGLYIARQIVLAGAGKLEAQSSDGTTTFVMRLPRVAPPASPPDWQAEGHA